MGVCLFTFDIFIVLAIMACMYRVSRAKVLNRMLLEPRCPRSISRNHSTPCYWQSQPNLDQNIVIWSLLTKTLLKGSRKKNAYFTVRLTARPGGAGGVQLINCPSQLTCVAHFDLCICHLYFITNPQ